MNLNEKSVEELQNLYLQVIKMRKDVLELVQEYGYTTDALITKQFEHDIERAFGRMVLKKE